MHTKVLTCFALVAFAFFAAPALAGDCCQGCGCDGSCQKTCRLVCETKKVPKVTYTCECENFCVPGPSDHCKTYDECGHKKIVYTPTCATVYTRKVLVKHEEMEEKPSYKWVVENLCPSCSQQCAAAAAAAPAEVLASKPRLPASVKQVQFHAENSSGDAKSGGLAAQLMRVFDPITKR